MKRALIITGSILGGLVALVALLLAILLFVIDPNDYKGEIAAVVKDKTDMTLTLDDRLEWTLWPSIGVKLGKLALLDTAGNKGAGETLVTVNHAAVSVQVMPLLSSRIAVDAVTLDGANVRFIQLADGGTSWDRLLAKLQSEPQTESEKVAFNVKQLDVKNTSLFLKDEIAGVERRIDNITVSASDIDPDAAFPLTAAFDFSQQDAAGKTLLSKNTFAATIAMDQLAEKYDLTGLAVTSALSGTLLPAPANISLKGNVAADMKAQQIKVDALDFTADYLDPALKEPANVQVKGNVLADLAGQIVKVDGLNTTALYFPTTLASAATVSMTGNVVADLKQTLATLSTLQIKANWPDATRPQPLSAAIATNLTANWGTGEIDAPQFAVNAIVPDKAYPKPMAVAFSSAIKANYLQGSASLPAFTLDALGVRTNGNIAALLPAMQADTPPDTPITRGMAVSGALATSTFNPRSVMAALGIAAPATADANVLKAASLKADIAGDEKKFLLKNLALKLDDTTVTGEAGISDLDSLRQFARLAVDRINADRYLPPASTAAAPAAPAAKGTPAAADLIPVDLLKTQNLDAALTIGALKIMTYDISGFRLAATAGNGVVNVSELRGTVLNGGFSIPVNINVQGAQPVVKLQPSLNRMDIAPLAKALLKKDLVAGLASYNGNLTVSGNSVNAMLQTVSGDSTLKFEDGLLHGVNVMNEVTSALGKYEALLPLLTGKDAATLSSKQNDTKIASFLSENTISNGVVQSKNFNTDIRQAKITGTGNFNLVTQTVDYQFNLALDKSVLGEKYAGYVLPVKCKGGLSGELTKLCGIDSRAVRDMVTKAALSKGLEKLGLQGGSVNEAVGAKKAEAEAAVQQKVDEEKAKAKEKVNEKINEGLNKLFKR